MQLTTIQKLAYACCLVAASAIATRACAQSYGMDKGDKADKADKSHKAESHSSGATKSLSEKAMEGGKGSDTKASPPPRPTGSMKDGTSRPPGSTGAIGKSSEPKTAVKPGPRGDSRSTVPDLCAVVPKPNLPECKD